MLRDRFLEGMSHAASTVNVVTTDGAEGRTGVTVSAMCSVSADPPSLLVCVHHEGKATKAIKQNGVLCVNVLRDDQSVISDTFAGRRTVHAGDQFACAQWTARTTGAPALVDALVVFDCRLKHDFRWGSHYIFIADVEDIWVNQQGSPLIYANRAYGTAMHLHQFVGQNQPQAATDELRVGCFMTFAPFAMPRLQRTFVEDHGDTPVRIIEGDQDRLIRGLASGELDLALMYDVGLDPSLHTTLLAEIPPYVLLPAAHPLSANAAVSLHELWHEPMVLLDVNPSRDYFGSLFSEHGLQPKVMYRSASFETVRSMVANGLGYSILVTKPGNAMSYDGQALTSRPLAEEVTPGRIVIAQGEVEANPKATEFVEHCRHYFSGLFAL